MTLATAVAAGPVILVPALNMNVSIESILNLILYGWCALGLSILFAAVFLTQVPKWAKDRSRDRITDWSYVACVFFFVLGLASFGWAAWQMTTS